MDPIIGFVLRVLGVAMVAIVFHRMRGEKVTPSVTLGLVGLSFLLFAVIDAMLWLARLL